MSLITIIDNACLELGIPTAAEVLADYSTNKQAYSTTQTHIARLRAFLYRASKIARDQMLWPELRREAVITLVAGLDAYPFPADFDAWIYGTEWDRTSQWPLIGPLSPQEWQARKSGVITTAPFAMYSVKGRTFYRIFIHPTPAAGDAGNTLYYEYQSGQWFLPKAWAATTVFGAASYCSHNGNIYKTTLGGTTGAVAPVHVTGSASDGLVTWVYHTALIREFTADSDVSLLDEDFLTAGIVWLYNRARGYPHEEQKSEWADDLKRLPQKTRGARAVSLNGRGHSIFLSARNLPQTGYGS